MNCATSVVPVSVVIPCYRCTATIQRAVQSVLAQSALPEQLILVDDASADGTVELLERIAVDSNPAWVEVIRMQTNRGPSAARNAGWQRARNRFVAFLDADDTWHPSKLARQFVFMDSHPEIWLSGHGHIVRRNGPDWAPVPQSTPWRRITLGSLLLKNRFITPSVMIRRDAPQRFDESRRYMEDHLLWMQMAADGLQVAKCDAPLAAVHKAGFGEAGLSSHLMAMSRADFSNYWILRRQNRITAARALVLSAWSAAKFARRMLYVLLMRLSSIAGGRRASEPGQELQ
jgi:glycosyltransferase involved in cell wall biosynthesis